ncbi:CBS domain-containing protein [Desulfoscipio gibsoniae]|uniref:Putative transcriptional regulator containing CBS domains n=1 Tax=Desulfoscipio gibsoniae DSM 7213 TaxID=767817 RepID=R4KIK9_9FIRM|nr:CBS domain-containing protein [Desulfoscipio gibsoniae]AGL03008.1 putative transcriptional regulator containing CBS domains [Desulfoscipio gibsoniae DSM 7213]
MNGPIRIMDIMRHPDNYPTVSLGQSIQQAWEIITSFYYNNSGVSCTGERMALVVDEENQFTGLISLESFHQSTDPWVHNVISRTSVRILENECDEITSSLLPHRKLEDIMIPVDKIALKSTDTASKAFSILCDNNVGTLPVLNIFRQIIGIVQAGDVFHALGLGSSFLKQAFMSYDYQRYGLFDDYYVDFLEELEKKNGAPQGTL